MIDWSKIQVTKSEPNPKDYEFEYENMECIMTVDEFKEDCEIGALIDYDGVGEMITYENGKKIEHGFIKPSSRHKIPSHITHVEWFNR